ncbi:MAG TPA: MFS transporter [Phycisphaerae bacterium]|nr:MFS transporter [Phycisphaerae bacterium]
MTGRLLRRKDVLSWCLYDWANSAFVTSVITVVLPVYFLTLLPEDGPVTLRFGRWSYATSGLALWSYLTAVYMLAAGLASPVLGAIADHTGGRKKFLAFCVFVGSVLTCGLFFATHGRYVFCGALFVGAAFLWSCGNLFYDALLPGLARDDREMDAVSNAGYAVGYLGGGLLLAVNLAMVKRPEWFGLSDASVATRAVFVTVGVWWALFSVPVLRYVREGGATRDLCDPSRDRQGADNPVIEGFRRLAATLRRVRQYRQLARLLVAFIFYNTGIGTVIVVAAAYGRDELDIPSETLIACILMIQFVGFPAAFGFIALARWLGARGAIFVGLGVYLGVVVFAFFMKTSAEFWVLGVLVALVQGGTQALSRSLYAGMIPAGHSAEFFGFFSIFNKVGSFSGPLCFAIVRDVTDSSRLAILFLATFFVVGAAILFTVNVGEGKGAPKAR